jgi:dolichyl-phosphate-mannose--protein O-mannosyl transferase
VSLDEILLYDDILVIAHTSNRNSLHSHHLDYQTGSGHQQVTAFGGRDDNDNWIIKGKHESGKKHKHTGEVKYNDVIRLKHAFSKKYLSIHTGHAAPVSTDYQEVCAAKKKHDEVNWVIEPAEEYGSESWNPQHEIRLRHEATGLYLHISPNNFDLGNGDSQGEIYAAEKSETSDRWFVESKTTIQHSKH